MTEINRVIDDVARAMTEARAVDMRARVLAELGDRRPAPFAWRLAPAIAVAAMLIVAVMVVRRASTPGLESPGRQAANVASSQPSGPVPQAPSLEPQISGIQSEAASRKPRAE